jgi:catalase
MADALIFELSKVQKLSIRELMVGHLQNVDEDFAQKVANGLGMKTMPPPAKAAKPTKRELPPSPELSILKNGPNNFKGRKLGILVSDGADLKCLSSLKAAAAKEGADVAIIAPTIGGIDASDGSHIDADFKINGGPSVLFDAVAVVISSDGAAMLANEATAKDFLSDAFAHLKFIAYNSAATALLAKAGIDSSIDEGFVELKVGTDATKFFKLCHKLRVWDRQDKVKMPT